MSGPAIGPDGRWVCRRCHTTNGANAPACISCGLLRGANVPSASIVRAATARRAWARRVSLTRLTFIGVIVVAVIGVTWFVSAHRDNRGSITEAGNLSPFELQVGDCFDLIDVNAEETDTVRGVPCDQPHVYEVYWIGDHSGGDYPDSNQVITFVEENCTPAFEDYVGVPPNASSWYFSFGGPTAATWADGQRTFACYLHNLDETPATGSARQSGS